MVLFRPSPCKKGPSRLSYQVASYWRADREAEGARLLSEYTPKAYLGFESPALRHLTFQEVWTYSQFKPLFSLISAFQNFGFLPVFHEIFAIFLGIMQSNFLFFWQTNNYQIYLRSKRQIRHLSSRYICHIFSLYALLCLQIASFVTFWSCVYKINLKTILKFTNL